MKDIFTGFLVAAFVFLAGNNMDIPQILIIISYSVNLLLYAHDHGKPKEGYTNFWVGLIGTSISMGLLWWGGFFK